MTVAFGYLYQLDRNCNKIITIYRLERSKGDCVSSAALSTVFAISNVLARPAIKRRDLKTAKKSKLLGVCCSFSLPVFFVCTQLDVVLLGLRY